MSLRRLNRKIKTLAAKGKPGLPRRHVTKRIDAKGKLREFHATKGWGRLV